MKSYHVFAALTLTCALGLSATSAVAGETLATYSENSGTLPPAYAWHYDVTFAADGTVNTRYCKGYGDTAPDCATRSDSLPADRLAALQAALAPIAADLAANPVAELTEPPVGGGSTTAQIFDSAGTALLLPPFPTDADTPRTIAAIDVLRAFTPAGALDDTKSRAVQPE
jgi:hypothetical protein